MKSHDLAKQLQVLARVLKRSPNIELEKMEISDFASPFFGDNLEHNDLSKEVAKLATLNRVEKKRWIQLIEDFGFDIYIRDRDGNRDIIGKLLNHLKDNDKDLKRLFAKQPAKGTGESSELASALTILLK